jgi:cytochrome c oxidase subunit 4
VAAEHKHTNYIAIWWWLLVLTLAEVGVAYLPRIEGLKEMSNITAITIILLVGMAFAKALLVALYFMHLRFERRTFVMVVSFPIVLAVVLVIMLLPDVGFKQPTTARASTVPAAHE